MPAITIDTLIHARWIIPVEPHEIILEHHALAINQGNIIDILPSITAKTKYSRHSEENLSSHVLIPGLINTHTHSPMVLFRGLADDLPLMTWLTKHIWPAEAACLSEDFVREGTELAIAEMLLSGTTCFNEHYFYPDITAQTALEHGIRANIGLLAIDAPTPWAKNAEECLEKGIKIFKNFQNNPNNLNNLNNLISFSLAPHSPYMLNNHHLTQINNLSKQYNLPIHMHLHETQQEITTSLEHYKQRPLERLYNLGLLSNTFQAVHMTQISPEDITLIQQTGLHIIHCPESNLKLASGFCPVHTLAQANINIALGTDGAASNNDLDMFSEMRSCALLAKAIANDPTAISAACALRMATLNGAKAMGLDKYIGSLAIGKAADIIAIDLSEINTQPVYNPISQLVYAAHSKQVTDVWIAGKKRVHNRQLITMNKEHLAKKAHKWQTKIQALLN